MKKKQKILVLGADGFLGSNLVFALLKDKKNEVRALDLFKDGVSQNLESARKKIEIFQGNFLNKNDLRKALQGIDYVFHFVSFTTPGSSMSDPLIDIDTNLKGTINLLEECVKAKVKKIIYPSSGGAIYGDQKKEKYSEEDSLYPISPYAISKLAIEKYLEYYRIFRGLDYLVARISNPYGPHQNVVGNQGIIPIFLNLIKNSQPISIFGDGKNIRDYIFVDDAIDNLLKLSFGSKNKYRIYNIGSGEGISINELVEAMKKITQKRIKTNGLPQRKADIRSIVLDISRIQQEFDYSPKVNLEKGIKQTWEWVKKID